VDARLQRRIQRYGWDKAAPFYERYWQAQLAPARARLLELADLKRGARVLELACGTGLVTFPVAETVGAAGAVLATDISDAMVEHVAAESRRRGTTHVAAARMDAETIDCADASFDVVLCALGLMYVPDPTAALREWWRVLRPGGRVVAAVWGARSRCGWAEIFPIVDARVQSEVCPMFFQLGTGDSLARAMSEARFERVEADRLSCVLEYASADDACGAAFAGGPVALAHARFDERTRADAHAEYLASIERWRAGTGYAIPGEFVIARGEKPDR
jgi:ubiquinone/menaquinone biosynthesis C-methylase UbiE